MAIRVVASLVVGFLVFVAESQVLEPCQYADCSGYPGACRRQEGVEYCVCPSSRGGYLCDMTSDPCGPNSCQNGLCFNETVTNGTYCVCDSGYSGSRCEELDDKKQCSGSFGDGDPTFLPTCTLTTTLTLLSQCVNMQLPYYDYETMPDPSTATTKCIGKVVETKHCIYRTIQQCSLNLCPSIYQYGGAELYQRIAQAFYNPKSDFSQQLFTVLCSPPDTNGTFQYPMQTYNIGEPVCGSKLIDNLLRILTDFVNDYPSPAEICPGLTELRTKLYNEVTSSCDWTKVGAALNLTDPPGFPGYVTKAFETAQELFQEWVVPGCGAIQECTATCMNNGTCFVADGVSKCNCSFPYHGERCEFFEGCSYTICQNGASCNTDSFGVEYCFCPANLGGLFCELEIGSCDDVQCQNGGSCYNSSIYRSCVCPPGYSGPRCQFRNESKQCPTPAFGTDMIFLQTCTLKSTLEKLSDCINHNLPFVDSTVKDPLEECQHRIHRVKQCMYSRIAECSNTLCESAYDYGGLELYLNISEKLYDPDSNFSKALVRELCVLPSNIPETYTPRYFIGEPVCKSNLIDRLLTISLESYKVLQMNDSVALCGALERLKYALYNETKASCNFSSITKALPGLYDPLWRPAYWQRLLEMAQEYFLEWTIPLCRVQTDLCNNYCVNGGICTVTLGAPFCSCPPPFGGLRCENIDPKNVCPVQREGDALFLPLCTIRTTLNSTLLCFADFALAAGGIPDYASCSAEVYKSFNCFVNMIGNCSRSTCPSIYNIEGVAGVVQSIVSTLLNPNVIAVVTQFACQVPPTGGYSQFLTPLIANVSIPFCDQSLFSELVGVLAYIETEVMGINDLSQVCSIAKEVRGRIGGLLNRCDFSNLRDHVDPALASYLHTVVGAVRSIVNNFTLPGCRGTEGRNDSCPMVTSSSSQCELADAWMCNYFQYGMSLTEWAKDFIEWMRDCTDFQHRNWDDWASSMGLIRGDFKYSYIGSGYGVDGFERMVRANVPCPTISNEDCMGRIFTTYAGCTICYKPGASRNVRSLIGLYGQEFKNYQVLVRIYNALRDGCSGSTLSCGGETSTTVPPMPTFSSSFSTVTHVPPSSSFFPTSAHTGSFSTYSTVKSDSPSSSTYQTSTHTDSDSTHSTVQASSKSNPPSSTPTSTGFTLPPLL